MLCDEALDSDQRPSRGRSQQSSLTDLSTCHVVPRPEEPLMSEESTMPDAVIVSAVRSPIGRAFKGSLTSIRPDDLAVQVAQAALDRVPEVDPQAIDDLILGCGLPAGEQGYNLGRVVAVGLGYDHLPGVTVNRFCASSLQSTRMAMHAIRAREGEIFLSV